MWNSLNPSYSGVILNDITGILQHLHLGNGWEVVTAGQNTEVHLKLLLELVTLRHLVTSCDILWHLVTSCDLSWQPVAVQGKIWRNPRELTFLYISVIGGSWNAAEFCLERLQNIANCWSLLTELHPSIPMAFLSSKILFTWNLKAKFMFKSQFWMVALLSSKFLRPGRMFHLNPTVHG